MNRRRRGWGILGAFWLLLLVGLSTGAGVLQYLGPVGTDGPEAFANIDPSSGAGTNPALTQDKSAAASPGQLAAYEPPAPLPDVKEAPHKPVETLGTGPGNPGSAIAGPISELLEQVPEVGGAGLPRNAPGRKPPMQAYAGGFDPADHRPRIALMLAGIGLSTPDSEEAIRILPAGVTLAVSAYASDPERLLEKARARGHEFVLSIPMEAQGFPSNDEGPHALLTGATRSENRDQLYWALSRLAGYAGATGALDGMRGERFAASGEQMALMLDELSRRGLYYIDPRPGSRAPLHIRGRGVDVLVDEPAGREEIAGHLAQLEQIARDKGQSLGLVGLPRPVTVDRLAEWTAQLASRGLVLVPVSALLQPVTAALR